MRAPRRRSCWTAEVAKLSPERTLVETDEFSVLLAKTHEIPNVLHEIGTAARIHFPASGRRHRQRHRSRSLRRTLLASVRLEPPSARSRRRLPAWAIGRDPGPFRRQRFLHQPAFPMERVFPRPHQAGARAGPILRAPGISEDLRAAAAVVERHRPISGPAIRNTKFCSAR